jgi:hypothetical protein
MKLIPNFLLNLFKPKPFVSETPVAAPPAKKRRNSKNHRAHGNWVLNQLRDYDGVGTIIVRVPDGIDMQRAQNTVLGYACNRFGKGVMTSRRFPSARTIHLRPRVPA